MDTKKQKGRNFNDSDTRAKSVKEKIKKLSPVCTKLLLLYFFYILIGFLPVDESRRKKTNIFATQKKSVKTVKIKA